MNSNILAALDHPALFGPWFKDASTWRAWRAFLCALFGLPMDGGALDLFRLCTGRETAPAMAALEAWLVCGRRSGKSFIAALIAVFLACFKDWEPYLQHGERGTIVIIAADRKQARVILRYIMGLLRGVESLAAMIERELAESVSLSNRIDIEVMSASYQRVRGYTVVAALLDECAFWQGVDADSASPDFEVVNALRPAMATVPGAMLIGLSSPYSKRGILFEQWRDHFGKDGDPVLVWQSPTETMNPTVPDGFIAAAYERDPASAAAEYGAEFRSDVSSFMDAELVDMACREDGRDLPPVDDVGYVAFVDPSGGRSDAMTLAIGHCVGERRIVDVVRVRQPPFSPADVVAEFCGILGRYGVSRVTGDRYGAEWVSEQFGKHGVSYTPSPLAKSDIYREALPAFSAGEVEIPRAKRLIVELRNLERRVGRSGRDIIDHGPRGHDDIANAVCGVLVNAPGAVPGKAVFAIDGGQGVPVEGHWQRTFGDPWVTF